MDAKQSHQNGHDGRDLDADAPKKGAGTGKSGDVSTGLPVVDSVELLERDDDAAGVGAESATPDSAEESKKTVTEKSDDPIQSEQEVSAQSLPDASTTEQVDFIASVVGSVWTAVSSSFRWVAARTNINKSEKKFGDVMGSVLTGVAGLSVPEENVEEKGEDWATKHATAGGAWPVILRRAWRGPRHEVLLHSTSPGPPLHYRWNVVQDQHRRFALVFMVCISRNAPPPESRGPLVADLYDTTCWQSHDGKERTSGGRRTEETEDAKRSLPGYTGSITLPTSVKSVALHPSGCGVAFCAGGDDNHIHLLEWGPGIGFNYNSETSVQEEGKVTAWDEGVADSDVLAPPRWLTGRCERMRDMSEWLGGWSEWLRQGQYEKMNLQWGCEGSVLWCAVQPAKLWLFALCPSTLQTLSYTENENSRWYVHSIQVLPHPRLPHVTALLIGHHQGPLEVAFYTLVSTSTGEGEEEKRGQRLAEKSEQAGDRRLVKLPRKLPDDSTCRGWSYCGRFFSMSASDGAVVLYSWPLLHPVATITFPEDMMDSLEDYSGCGVGGLTYAMDCSRDFLVPFPAPKHLGYSAKSAIFMVGFHDPGAGPWNPPHFVPNPYLYDVAVMERVEGVGGKASCLYGSEGWAIVAPCPYVGVPEVACCDLLGGCKGSRVGSEGSEERERDVSERETLERNEERDVGIEHLPMEMLLKIFSHLDVPSLCACAAVCRRWYDGVSDPVLWRALLRAEYGSHKGGAVTEVGEKSEMFGKTSTELIRSFGPEYDIVDGVEWKKETVLPTSAELRHPYAAVRRLWWLQHARWLIAAPNQRRFGRFIDLNPVVFTLPPLTTVKGPYLSP